MNLDIWYIQMFAYVFSSIAPVTEGQNTPI